MDYFQGVVTEFLRSKRSVFVNTECLIQLDDRPNALKGRHWYCDIVAADFSEKTVYLCEVTYSATMQSLVNRLVSWGKYWPMLVSALRRDCGIPQEWTVCPWVFIPEKYKDKFWERFRAMGLAEMPSAEMPRPRVTLLESTLPWKYLATWNRKVDALDNDV